MATSKRTYGVGVVGAGWVSGEHIKAYASNENARMVGIYSRTPERATAKLDEYGVKGITYSTFDALLADPDIDIVSICSPPPVHAEQVIAAASAGKHIVIEKPVAMNIQDVRRMQKAIQEAKVSTVVSFVLRWNPMFETTKQLLEDDAVGKLMYLECDYWHWIGPHYGQYAWSRTKEAGGSSLLSAGCHAVDALRWFGGEIEEVFSYSVPGFPGSDYEFEPNTVALLRFTSGATGKISSMLECTTPYIFNVQLLGEKGTIRNNKVFSHKYPGQSNYLEYPTILPDSGDVTHHPFKAQIDYFIDCLLKGEPSHTDINDAAKTMEACFAIEQSAKTGKPVRLPLA
ncbi:MAG: Gfo/Idh/MocA family protein [Limnochordia bacterium]